MKYITRAQITKFVENTNKKEYSCNEFYTSRKKAVEAFKNLGYELDGQENKYCSYMFKKDKMVCLTREIIH